MKVSAAAVALSALAVAHAAPSEHEQSKRFFFNWLDTNKLGNLIGGGANCVGYQNNIPYYQVSGGISPLSLCIGQGIDNAWNSDDDVCDKCTENADDLTSTGAPEGNTAGSAGDTTPQSNPGDVIVPDSNTTPDNGTPSENVTIEKRTFLLGALFKKKISWLVGKKLCFFGNIWGHVHNPTGYINVQQTTTIVINGKTYQYVGLDGQVQLWRCLDDNDNLVYPLVPCLGQTIPDQVKNGCCSACSQCGPRWKRSFAALGHNQLD